MTETTYKEHRTKYQVSIDDGVTAEIMAGDEQEAAQLFVLQYDASDIYPIGYRDGSIVFVRPPNGKQSQWEIEIEFKTIIHANKVVSRGTTK